MREFVLRPMGDFFTGVGPSEIIQKVHVLARSDGKCIFSRDLTISDCSSEIWCAYEGDPRRNANS